MHFNAVFICFHVKKLIDIGDQSINGVKVLITSIINDVKGKWRKVINDAKVQRGELD